MPSSSRKIQMRVLCISLCITELRSLARVRSIPINSSVMDWIGSSWSKLEDTSDRPGDNISALRYLIDVGLPYSRVYRKAIPAHRFSIHSMSAVNLSDFLLGNRGKDPRRREHVIFFAGRGHSSGKL